MRKSISSKNEPLLYIETAKQRAMEVIFKYPEREFSLSDLAKEARVKKSNIGKILENLEKEETVQITKLTNIWRIKANQRSENYIRNKIVYNLHLIYQSGLLDFLIKKFDNPKAIILFGSYRKGDDISSSNIDIAIESYEKEHKIIELKEDKFKALSGKKIHLHIFNRKNIDINLFNNIANGIILKGFLEVKP